MVAKKVWWKFCCNFSTENSVSCDISEKELLSAGRAEKKGSRMAQGDERRWKEFEFEAEKSSTQLF